MTIRSDTLKANLKAFLARYSPPKGLLGVAIDDEVAALVRAVERAAPANGYEAWWPRFEDAIAEGMRTRAWPTVGDVVKAASALPKMRAREGAGSDDNWLEAGLRKQLRRWLDGCHGDGPKGIPAHVVTRERLNAIGVFGAEADAALAWVADPRNGGVDRTMTEDNRNAYAAMLHRWASS